MRQTVSVETAASPDVLARVTMLLARGNLSVADLHAEREGVRFQMTMTLAAESERQLNRFIRQAERLIDVYSVAPCSEKGCTAGQD
ncbi:ACT domain-containing protein [Sporolactobacillus nakayamae]|uniref:ACT domain-containing protein n=1 Tax=Sporolactobacillus nakayamae TaxID=269670 RepID=A0A1I2PM87_9BACL|nr:ACT domain-containing protein [Sporolactobacillus nakayamae]SFG17262.1 ACT domain-containing protein [Sporolactobacillus nakayamae]